MTQRLIIIRGNSGSGKSTIAKRLQVEMGRGTMLIPQDVIRRDILKVLDEPGNASVDLIYEMAMFGRKKSYDVIVEGILSNDKYEDMLKKLINDFEGETYVYSSIFPLKRLFGATRQNQRRVSLGKKRCESGGRIKITLVLRVKQSCLATYLKTNLSVRSCLS